MLTRIITSIALSIGFGVTCLAHEGHSHAKHNMVLFGENQIFASHIVYKVPHNYQVILSLTLSQEDRDAYLAARRDHPSDQFIYLLNTMDIKDIATQKIISGPVFYLDSEGNKHEVIPSMKVSNDNFKVIYFDELPLSLEKHQPSTTNQREDK